MRAAGTRAVTEIGRVCVSRLLLRRAHSYGATVQLCGPGGAGGAEKQSILECSIIQILIALGRRYTDSPCTLSFLIIR